MGGKEQVADVTPFMIMVRHIAGRQHADELHASPFGFALFYLRSVAPKEPYQDKVTGRMMPPIQTSEIYWGAVPFVIIQILMVAIVLLSPQLTMAHRIADAASKPAVVNTEPASARTVPAVSGQGISLPPVPPTIDGISSPPSAGDMAPALDMTKLPNFDVPERTLPEKPR